MFSKSHAAVSLLSLLLGVWAGWKLTRGPNSSLPPPVEKANEKEAEVRTVTEVKETIRYVDKAGPVEKITEVKYVEIEKNKEKSASKPLPLPQPPPPPPKYIVGGTVNTNKESSVFVGRRIDASGLFLTIGADKRENVVRPTVGLTINF